MYTPKFKKTPAVFTDTVLEQEVPKRKQSASQVSSQPWVYLLCSSTSETEWEENVRWKMASVYVQCHLFFRMASFWSKSYGNE